MDHQLNNTDLKAMADLRKWNLRHPGLVKKRIMNMIMDKHDLNTFQLGYIREEWLRLGGKP